MTPISSPAYIARQRSPCCSVSCGLSCCLSKCLLGGVCLIKPVVRFIALLSYLVSNLQPDSLMILLILTNTTTLILLPMLWVSLLHT